MAELVEVIQADKDEAFDLWNEVQLGRATYGAFQQAFARHRIATRPPASEVAEEGWRPIEEAPRDGTKVDIWIIPDPERAKLFTNGANWTPYRVTDASFNGSEGAGWRSPRHGRLRNYIATHFRLPPKPPALASGEQP